MAEPTLLPPLGQLTPNDHGPIVSLSTFIFLSCTLIVVLAKIASMLYLKRSVPSVDIPIWICLIVAFDQSILIQIAVNRGMGKHRSEVPSDSLDAYNKLNYTAELLLLLVLALSKVSTGNLIRSISPSKSILRWGFMVQIGLGVWTLLALFGTAFQCRAPYWEYSPSRCIGKGAVVYPIMVLNMALDAALVVLPIVMLWNVQMPLVQRLKVSVIVVNIVQMTYLKQYLNSTDSTCMAVLSSVCVDAYQCAYRDDRQRDCLQPGNDEHQRHHRLYPESLPRDHQSSPRNEHRPYARGHRAELHGKLHETQLAFNAQILQIVQAESRPRE
ncbi:hypothetical protein KXW95_003063 [Aspergillus fumigatus]|nr:hypothetical protein KXX27_002543 [Aspergillus fumigatus]KAH1879157.1 hypothetical protein KXW95_003063 [Aspergillus fumigatus]KAH1899351.1 hypothetical protein KXW04_004453 [Aspergillus fumigatus]KAH2444428.1 hypothetical protein KXV83_002095 [Aspergillus fumigatus]KAH2507138.1 hypothetical protein KXW70_009455 [Aspergillus fumigatus]